MGRGRAGEDLAEEAPPRRLVTLQTSVMMQLSSSMASAALQPRLARITFTAWLTARALAASDSVSSGCIESRAEIWDGARGSTGVESP